MASKIFDVARYKIGDVVWWVNLEPTGDVQDIQEKDEWMKTHHPKVLFERNYYKPLWKTTAALPRLEKTDFLSIMHILTCELEVNEFAITSIARSQDTGEFFYANSYAEWMPESYLFDTKEAGYKEKKRILNMVKKWCDP